MSNETQGKMGVTGIALFTLCAVLVVDTLTASASIGVSAIGWWVLMLVFFVIPYGLITSELSTTYPGEGGIYDWVKQAFNFKWAVRTTWFYWINVGLWMPAVYIMFAGMFAELFMPGLSLWGQIAICILLTWLTVWICNVSADIGVWVTNIGAILKIVVISTLGVGGFIYAMKNGVANEFTLPAMMPSLDSAVSFLPAIVFNLMGFELVATMTKEMKDVRDMPKAVFLSIGITAFLYIFGTVGILMALPVESIGLVSGLIDTFKTLFGAGVFGTAMVYIFGTFALLTLIGNMVSWTMGASRAAAEAAQEGELPAPVAKVSEKGSPVGANNITGTVSTVVILSYALFAQGNDDLFWSIFAFSSCIFLLPYLFMFPAYLKLRVVDGKRERPFKVPGGMAAQWVMSIVCFFVILQAVILFIFPEALDLTVADWGYTGPVLIGVIATILAGEWILLGALKRKKQQGSDDNDTADTQDKKEAQA
ncbi:MULTISPECIES: APC family permease [Vibrio]|uniref:APC family permease n=1 Tax=Vibrio TaxID=662 RepID=UPI0006319744|nr:MULTISPECIES: APC family permease [Vibrio]MBE8575903.1 APC family permease [Vibrio sp. OPT18]MBU2909690.1 APC family permease [Vibrio splendidus]MCK8070349.1 APC family permease [Vibrio sp. 1CM23M]MCK8075035.1 APC family permease [Vibrio sp. 1CM2L]MDO6532065.1 APC family permease [Vibrio splendidus]